MMPEPEGDHPLYKIEEFPVFFQQGPIVPGDFIVLAIGVVVPPLGPGHFIPPQDHGGAEGNHEGCDEILLLPQPGCFNGPVGAGPLESMVMA